MNIQYYSGVKFVLQPTHEQYALLKEHCIRYRQVFNILSKEVYLNYLQDNGKLINQVDGVGAGNAVLRLRMILKKDYSHIFDKYSFETETLRRNITFQVANRYRGYYRRNKIRPKRIISMNELTAITYNDMMISYKDGYITIPIFGGKDKKDQKLHIKCVCPKGMISKIYKLPKVFGGTLDNKRGTFVFIALVKNKLETIYEPTDWLGYDIGIKNFLYFSDTINGVDFLNHNTRQISILKYIQELLKEINRKDIRTGYRSLCRKQWLNAIKQHKSILKPIADLIITHAINNKLGLALDGAKFGGKSGSSGQEITDILKHRCIQQKIPFYITKAAYTSQTCPQCGYKHKNNRHKEEFKCLSCGYANHADKVGAINSANQAKTASLTP
jgi:transposase